MPNRTWTVAFERDGKMRKLFTIIFGGDGSYFVRVPYHPERKAMIFKRLVNYAAQPQLTPFEGELVG